MDTNPLLRPVSSLLLLAMCSFFVTPIYSVTTNQRPLSLIQKPLKHSAAPDTLAAVHAAQGHQWTAAARAWFAARLIALLPSLRCRCCSIPGFSQRKMATAFIHPP